MIGRSWKRRRRDGTKISQNFKKGGTQVAWPVGRYVNSCFLPDYFVWSLLSDITHQLTCQCRNLSLRWVWYCYKVPETWEFLRDLSLLSGFSLSNSHRTCPILPICYLFTLLLWTEAISLLVLCVFAQSRNFTVTVITKTAAHPTFGFPGGISSGYAINGVEGATLTLEVGVNYTFVLNNVGCFHPFYFTRDSNGGGTPGLHFFSLCLSFLYCSRSDCCCVWWWEDPFLPLSLPFQMKCDSGLKQCVCLFLLFTFWGLFFLALVV